MARGSALAGMMLAVVTAGCATAPAPGPEARAQRRALKARGMAAYEGKDYPACVRLLEQAGDAYDAACCAALGGDAEGAFRLLQAAARQATVTLRHLQRDSDLEPLHADPRWPGVVAALAARLEEKQKDQHPELLALYEADQADRVGAIDWKVVQPRDRARQARTRALLDAGAPRVSADWLHAAFIFQHGDTLEDIALAHRLALEAVRLDPDDDGARWIAAASLDRRLMREGKPQRYGTQYTRPSDASPWELYPVDPAVTDEERAEWAVPSLAAARAQLERMNARR